MTTVETAVRSLGRRTDTHVTARVTAAALLIAVAYIHFADQSFLAFDKSPAYLQGAYLVLEVAAVVVAVVLLPRPTPGTWLLALGCAAGPLAAFIATRTVGLPGAKEDIGNWGEPLGVASLIVEATLLLLAVVELGRLRRSMI